MKDKIVISIHTQWLKKIMSGEKTVELRKSRPQENIPFPFTVYFYETKVGGRGAVVAEGQCFLIERAEPPIFSYGTLHKSGLSIPKVETYAKHKPVYGWYIAKVVEYKHPKPLSDFGLVKAPQSWGYVTDKSNVQ